MKADKRQRSESSLSKRVFSKGVTMEGSYKDLETRGKTSCSLKLQIQPAQLSSR